MNPEEGDALQLQRCLDPPRQEGGRRLRVRGESPRACLTRPNTRCLSCLPKMPQR